MLQIGRVLTASSIIAPFMVLSKHDFHVVFFSGGPRVHIYFHFDSKHFTMFPALQQHARRERILRALADVQDAGVDGRRGLWVV